MKVQTDDDIPGRMMDCDISGVVRLESLGDGHFRNSKGEPRAGINVKEECNGYGSGSLVTKDMASQS